MTDSNIDSELLQETRSPIFVNAEGEPLLFRILVTDEDRNELCQLIVEYGGAITDEYTGANGNGVIVISRYFEVHHDTYDPRFIFDSVFNKKLLKFEDYKNTVHETSGDVQQLVSYLNENQNQDDDANNNLQQDDESVEANASNGVVSNSHDHVTQDSQVLNAIAEAGVVATTGGSSSKPQHAIGSKNGFSEQEDQIILEQVRRNPHKRSSHKLFYDIAKILGRHTGNSIRYRFRNNLANHLNYVYKIDEKGNLLTDSENKFIKSEDLPQTLKRRFTAKEDYELSKAIRTHLEEKDIPEFQRNPTDVTLPGKFFEQMASVNPNHSKAAWRDRYRKFIVPYGLDNYIQYYETEIAADRIPQEIKNFTGKHIYKSKKNLNNIEEEIGAKLVEHNNQFEEQSRKKRKTPGNYSKTHDSDVQILGTGSNPNDSTNVFIAGDHDDLHDLDNSNYYNAHTAVAVAQASGSNNDGSQRAPDPEELLTSDLVTAKFFTFQPIITVIDKISEIVERSYDSTDAENLIQALYDEAGIQKKFGTFIITSVCGDLSMIPKYLDLFLKTGQNPPKNVNGIWTALDDEYLKSGEEDKISIVRALHGDKRIELRKQFISQELI